MTPTVTPSKKGHSRSRSGVVGEESPILQGWLARESGVVSQLLNRRFGALYPTSLVTYRKETDDTPSKVWTLTRDVSLSPVASQTYKLRHAKTSTLWAVTAKAYDAKDMWGFALRWPNSGVMGQDHLVLAFEEESTAREWHDALVGVLERAPARSVSHMTDVPSRQTSLTPSEIEEYKEFGGTSPSPVGSRERSGEVERGAERGVEVERGVVSPGAGVHRRAVSEDSTPAHRPRSWASVMHINGVALFVEDSDTDGSGGAIMVSAVVKAPPVEVFRNLVHTRKEEGHDVFSGARVLEVIDASTQVVAQNWSASGIAGSFLAPRQFVLLRTWRRDEDGTYIVLYQSTRHRSVPEPKGWGWRTPVRVGVQAAGFTIAPLLPKYYTEGESRECLLTMVLKADFGGVVSERSRLGRVLGPLGNIGVRGLLEPVVSAVIVLRDKVEQDRFVLRPLSASDPSTVAGLDSGVLGPGDESARRRAALQKRTATTLAYRREPLLLAQRAVEERQLSRLSMMPPGALAALQVPSPDMASVPEAPQGAEGVEASLPSVEEVDADAWAISGTCPRQYWSSPGDAGFKVRGPTYLTDKRKIPAGQPVFELVAADLLELEEPLLHVARHLPSVRNSPAPFLFCVQMMVPCKPPVALVASWAAPIPMLGRSEEELIAAYETHQGSPLSAADTAVLRAIAQFLTGDGPEADKVRNKHFKLIPHISKGAWIMQKSVGTTPVILGQKLSTKYFRGRNYFEVDVDIGASSVAASITNMVVGATKSLTLDMGVLLEGQTPATLPEQLLGTIRLAALDMKSAAYFDESAGRIIRPADMDK